MDRIAMNILNIRASRRIQNVDWEHKLAIFFLLLFGVGNLLCDEKRECHANVDGFVLGKLVLGFVVFEKRGRGGTEFTEINGLPGWD